MNLTKLPTRREVIASIGVCAGTLALQTSSAVAVQPHDKDACRRSGPGLKVCRELMGSSLCLASPNQVSRLDQSAKPPPAASLPWKERELISESSVSGFDSALKTNVLQPLSEIFSVRPRFGYYNEDQHDGRANAIASDDFRSGNIRGTVLFGLKLLHRMLAAPGGDYAAMAVCAHEFAHIKQFQTDIQEQIASVLPCYCIELHADFLAGFFIRRVKAVFGAADIQRIGQVWDAWETATCTHGTNVQRLNAIEQGFKFGDPDRQQSPDAAVKAGFEYLRRYG